MIQTESWKQICMLLRRGCVLSIVQSLMCLIVSEDSTLPQKSEGDDRIEGSIRRRWELSGLDAAHLWVLDVTPSNRLCSFSLLGAGG